MTAELTLAGSILPTSLYECSSLDAPAAAVSQTSNQASQPLHLGEIRGWRHGTPSSAEDQRGSTAMEDQKLKDELSRLLGWDPMILNGVCSNIFAARQLEDVMELVDVSVGLSDGI